MHSFSRRTFIRVGSAVCGLAIASNRTPGAEWSARLADRKDPPPDRARTTKFQIACMTLPYSQFPLERALYGIKSAGFRYVAWGTSHLEDGKKVPVMATDAPPEKAKELAKRCRDMGLEPVMMFSEIYPEADKAQEVLTNRLSQAAAAGIGQVLTFGHTRGGDRKLWIDRFKALGPVARDKGVLLVVKQHGGDTGTGAVCAEITREVADESIKVNYDAGNVMDYLHVDPLPDVKKCADEVRSFCIKDHRMFPRDQDCGPGLGEIDHYKLLYPLAFTGKTMPLCCENIFAPALARPAEPEALDSLARRAREFLELVIQGIQA